jgi:hypothetical protein
LEEQREAPRGWRASELRTLWLVLIGVSFTIGSALVNGTTWLLILAGAFWFVTAALLVRGALGRR